MPEYSFKLDRVIRNVTQGVNSLKRLKDAGLKKILPDVYTKIKEMEKALDAVEKSPPVIDDQTYEQKVKRLMALVDACNAAETAVTNVANKPVHTPATVRKESGSVEVIVLPDRVNRPQVKDVPGVGKTIKDLSQKIAATKKQATTDLNGFTNWYKTVSKEGEISITIPKSITNMIQQVDKNGAITLPSDQCFTATITYEKIPSVIQSQFLAKLPQNLTTETGKALLRVKQDIAKMFQDWNSKFGEYKMRYDEPSAKTLFKNINFFFENKLPKLVEPELVRAAETAMDATLPPTVKSLKPKVKTPVKVDYSNFAEFVVNMPGTNPAVEVAEELTGDLNAAQRSEQAYTAAVGDIQTNYATMKQTTQDMLQLAEELIKINQSKSTEDNDKPVVDTQRERERDLKSKELAKALDSFRLAMRNAETNREQLAKAVLAMKKSYESSSVELGQNVTVNQRALKQLKDSLAAIAKRLDSELKLKLKGISEVERFAGSIVGTFSNVIEKPQDVKLAIDGARKICFKQHPHALGQSLQIADDMDDIRKNSEDLTK